MKSTQTLSLAVVGLALAGWVGYSFYTAYQPQPMRIQGMIEAQQYSISSKVPGRID
ncbi:HlyD family secretion protein, partial [Vibrio campbellii]